MEICDNRKNNKKGRRISSCCTIHYYNHPEEEVHGACMNSFLDQETIHVYGTPEGTWGKNLMGGTHLFITYSF